MNRKRIGSILVAMVMLASLLAVAGCAGDDGAVGPVGLRGLQGEQGAQGDTGTQGATGSQGEQGTPGAPGEQGTAGEQGVQGAVGADGADGAVGPQGSVGSGGPGGSRGTQGPAGVFPAFSVQLQVKHSGLATITYDTSTVALGSSRSFHLTTTGAIGDGEEARIVLTPNQAMSLNDIVSIAWQEYLTAGYPPHVDVGVLDATGVARTLVFEYAYNPMSHYTDEAPMPYGAVPTTWSQTFGDDNGTDLAVTDASWAWQSPGSSGPPLWVAGTLAQWKLGNVPGSVTGESPVIKIEIEVDNWVVQSDAYIDNITINGVAIPD